MTVLWLSALILALLPAAVFATWAAFSVGARRQIRTTAQAEPRRVALVLGARILSPGVPTALLADRLDTAADLYRLGKAERLLLTGDGGLNGPDEVETMRAYLLAQGIPENALLLDREGVRTLASLLRARDVFGVRSALVVTSPFHLPRTLFLARRIGLELTGVPAAARRPLSLRGRLTNQARERGAQLLALWEAGLHRAG